MQQTSHVPDLQSIITPDLYGGEQKPKTADIKQILDTLKDRVQPLSPVQMQIISYLEHLQSREIHKKSKNKVYQSLIDRIVDDAHKVAPPGFFIRVIEALIPRTTYIDGKSAHKLARESEGSE